MYFYTRKSIFNGKECISLSALFLWDTLYTPVYFYNQVKLHNYSLRLTALAFCHKVIHNSLLTFKHATIPAKSITPRTCTHVKCGVFCTQKTHMVLIIQALRVLVISTHCISKCTNIKNSSESESRASYTLYTQMKKCVLKQGLYFICCHNRCVRLLYLQD